MYRFKMLINEAMISRIAPAGTSPSPGDILHSQARPGQAIGSPAYAGDAAGKD